jgi:rSAM/selenodomain-associated transferase 2
MSSAISIVIPALNEEGNIGLLLDYLFKNGKDEVAEIIVVDGGSRDRTPLLARKSGAKVLVSKKKGRASQMNLGAKAASSPVIWFLHADTYPPEGFGRMIASAIEQGADSGCFTLQFDDSHPLLSVYSWFTGFETTLFRFGDQSLFVKKTLFEAIGGFDERLMVMEDQEVVRRIRKEGEFVLLQEPVVTSARKYRDNGVFTLQCIFSVIFMMYYIGASQDTLVHFYKKMIRTDQTESQAENLSGESPGF